MAGSLAERYEQRWPDTGIPEAQKALRQDMDDLKFAKRDGRLTMRTRYVQFHVRDGHPAFDENGRLRG